MARDDVLAEAEALSDLAVCEPGPACCKTSA